ncbi:MAG: FAD-dependent oxidoreductase [Ruminococcaceae bacterium]|nr:FAD-dependent oxidoreductase [Oscillospiraceae bacterium]
MNKLLGQPGKIGKMTTKNRIVMSPMEVGLADAAGLPTEAYIAYYEARARGGVGLIIPGIARVNDVHGGFSRTQLSVAGDNCIAPLGKLAEAMHRHDSRIFIQLQHPGRENSKAFAPLLAPSAIPCKLSRVETRAMTLEEIKELIGQFIEGAVRCQKAGIDGVELHAAHGYLINQFLSPYTNKREDAYGGSFENRMRFITEIIEGIRARCGDYPISVRLTGDELLAMNGVTEPYLDLKESIKIAQRLEQLGIDVLNISVGIYETGMTSIEPISFAQGWRTDIIRAVRDEVKLPVIANNLVREPAIAEKMLADKLVDFVGVGRALFADECWGNKAIDGTMNIRKCISCLHCFSSLTKNAPAGLPAECAVNPRFCRELRYPDYPATFGGKKVVVVGGGPAGLNAARTLKKRGADVVLFEKREEIGGQLVLGKVPPCKEKIGWVADFYQRELKALGADVRLGTEATAELIEKEKPDALVVATGGVPIVPGALKGVDGPNVYGVEDILSGGAALQGKQVVVVGAGMTGLETAETLAKQGNQVTVVDMLKRPAPKEYPTNVGDVMSRLKGVPLMLGQELKEIASNNVLLKDVESGEEKSVPADAVVLAIGYKPSHPLADALAGKITPLAVVGDANDVANIAGATRSAFDAAYDLFG